MLIGIGVVAILYVALLGRIWKEYHKALIGGIRTRFENEELIARLRGSQEMLADAIDGLPEAIAIYDAEDRLILCNRKYAQAQTGIDDPAQLAGKAFAELVRMSVERGERIEPEFAGNVEAWVAERIRRRQKEAGGPPRVYQIADGRWMLTSISRARTGGIVAVRTDITREREIEQSLQSALLEEQRIMDTATVGIVFMKDRKVVKCNRHFANLFAYSPEELVGHSSAIWFPTVENWQKVGHEAYAVVERGEPFEFEQEFVRKNGERIWCHVAGRILNPHNWEHGSIWVYSDITESKRRESEARELAHHDALTGLPNRRLLDDRLTQALAAARRANGRVAVLLLDLDRFKPINDAHGHEAGDAVLKVVAGRLQDCVRESDTVARVGGDEFVVMLALRGGQHAARVAEKILAALAEPIPVAAARCEIGGSIGVSVYPDDADEKEELLKYADRAMYNAKAAGRNCCRFYSRETATSAQAGVG
jgi:diguanylate cyclase (GGDEF)-like protein/PAS domain S-box-containing protein